MMQLRMDLEWVFLIGGDACWIVLAYRLDRTILTGLYRINWIVSYRLDRFVSYRLYCIWKHRILCAGWLLPGWDGWDGWTGWDIGKTGEGCNEVTWFQMGDPPLAPEWERHHWLLRGGGLWEVVAGTNCVHAARARSICVGAAK